MALHIGNSVVVKSGVLDPDFGIDIGGWQGRIEEDGVDHFLIRWDSITLCKMGLHQIIRSMDEGLDWELMTLEIDELTITTPRDTKADVSRVVSHMEKKADDQWKETHEGIVWNDFI